MNIDTILDRPLAVTTAMVATLCALAALCVWVNVLGVRPILRRGHAAAPPAAITPEDIRGVMFACAVAFSIFAIRYAVGSAVRFRSLDWSTFGYDLLYLSFDVGMMAGAFWAIRCATRSVCGWHAVNVFAGIVLMTGALLWLWG